MRRIIIVLLLISHAIATERPGDRTKTLDALYTSLDPSSLAQHFAFYELYPNTPQGKAALAHAWELLGADQHPEILPSIDIQPLISFVNPTPNGQKVPILSETQLQTIEKLSQNLSNRNLKGFGIWNLQQLESLPAEEIDLTRGLFVAEMETDTPEERLKIRSYEAQLDLMALQILARLKNHPSPKEKIRAINHYIFDELRFRFPPHSLYAKDIDIYTQLPSVLDNRRGVCLGVSVLYLGLSQRLDLHLEAVTPPGHIFVRYVDPKIQEVVNIETTARGIEIPSEMYLGIETHALSQRTIREVIGLTFMNQASVYWHRKDFATTIKLYEKAQRFLPDDYLLTMLLGYNYLFAGRTQEGIGLLQKIQKKQPRDLLTQDTVAEDYLSGATDAAGILAIYTEIDEKRSSILAKQQKLKEVVQQFPSFRQGIFHLAITHLQLGREREALPLLEKYVRLTPNDPTANYYLAAIHFERYNFVDAWKYLQITEQIVHSSNHYPRALKDLRQSLQQNCPEPIKVAFNYLFKQNERKILNER